MPRRFFNAITILLLTLACAPQPRASAADDDKNPEKTFDDVFGESYKKALASASTVDDAALALDLSKAVLTIDMPASLIKVITQKLGVLADKTVSAALPAVDALDKLAEKDPTQRAAIDLQSIPLLEKAHASGESAETRNAAGKRLLARLVPLADKDLADRRLDSAVARYKAAAKIAKDLNAPDADAINARYAAANEQLRQAAEVDALEKRIEKNPKDGEARNKLIRIHLVERDDPSAAVWFVGEGVDDATKRLLPIAAKDAASADAKTLADLGAWYMDLAGDAALAAQPRIAMLTRAKTYYEKFLSIHKENDLLKAKATLSLDQIARKLKEAESSIAVKPSTPATPTTPTTPATPQPAGGLTVAIDGPTITDPERVERMYAQYYRLIAREYAPVGDDFAPGLDYDAKYPSSARESLADVKKRMTVIKEVRDGLIVRRVTVPPVPAEAEAVAMALPAFDVGAYGYVHSAEIVEIVGAEEMLVKDVWLVDPSTIGGTFDERKERDRIRRRQDDWNWGGPTLRLHGHPTAGLKVGDRVGMTGGKGKPLQFLIVKTEPQKNFIKPTRPVAVTTARLAKGLDEKQFEELLAKRNLTKTDLVNLYLEAQRAGARDAIANTIKRIELKGAKLP